MGQGQGSITSNQKKQPSGAPFSSGDAVNGLSVNLITGLIVLGQDIGEVGNPAVLLGNREIPMSGFNIRFLANGSIGINMPAATAPLQNADVRGTAGVMAGTSTAYPGAITFGATGNFHVVQQNNTWGQINSIYGANANPPGLTLYKTRGADAGTKAAVNVGDSIGTIYWASVASDLTVARAAEIISSAKVVGAGLFGIQADMRLNTTNAVGISPRITIDQNGSLKIGRTPFIADNSAILDIGFREDGITGQPLGILIPRMTTVQKNVIAAPATSLLVYDTTLNAYQYFDGVSWVGFGAGNTIYSIDDSLASNRIVDLNGLFLRFQDAGSNYLAIDTPIGFYGIGDIDGAANGTSLQIDDANQFIEMVSGSGQRLVLDSANGLYQIGDINSVGTIPAVITVDSLTGAIAGVITGATMLNLRTDAQLIGDTANFFNYQKLEIDQIGKTTSIWHKSAINTDVRDLFFDVNAGTLLYQIGDIDADGNNTFLQINDATQRIVTNGSNQLIGTTTTFSNNAGANLGTLSNAPTAGNPAKWIAIDDNGTTRYIPTWI